MKFSEQWLREWVDPPVDGERLLAQLTAAGMEVESAEPATGPMEGIVSAVLLDVKPHPDAERLSLCTVDDGGGTPLEVVCGAPNVHPGMHAPLARVGARLPDGTRIRRSKIRGVASQGMLCSPRELGLGDDHDGILALPGDTPVGVELSEVLGAEDRIIDVSLTPNRGDCLSVAGIAREVGVINRVPVAGPDIPAVNAVIEDAFPVRLEAPDGCPRYAGRIIRGVDPTAHTPLWLRERLRRAGVRSISPVVDVTNYVMLELGQPMHAFDLARLHGGIRVRRAEEGERLELLDGKVIELDGRSLVIADHERAVALAGIMGGLGSGVSEDSRDIFLESAYFTPLDLAGEARRHGLHTDASHRFERGVSPALQRVALERATALLLHVAGGHAGPVVDEIAPDSLPARPTVSLRAARLRHLLGVEVAPQTVADVLARLGMEVTAVEGGWRVIPPASRFDVTIEADLIEEVARIVGYDQVPLRPPEDMLAMYERPEARVALAELRAVLVERGYHEVITYSFVDAKLQAAFDPGCEPLPLTNPISAEMAVMRTTLWPGLAGALLYNAKRQRGRVRLFEHGLVFRPGSEGLAQTPVLGGVLAGPAYPEQWGLPERALDFFDAKGDVEALLAVTRGPEPRFEPAAHAALHPGQSARITRAGEAVGWVGRLHPALARELKLGATTFLFEVTASALTHRAVPVHEALSRFPSVRRDIAVVVGEGVSAQALRDCVGQCAIDVLQNLELFDVYRGEGIDSGKKSLALGLIFQAPLRTLSDEEVDRLVATVIDSLGQNLGATLRG